nr:response regulator transcription factor [uncultured Faecalimonas sp.]
MAQLLLVEDDESIVFGMKEALSRAGHTVISADSIASGKLCFSASVQLILLDLNLPDGTGYEFCQWVKTIRDVPVIFLTVQGEETSVTKGLDLGADDYIVKPFRLAELLSRIRAVLRRVPLSESPVLTCQNITLDRTKTSVFLDGDEVLLSALEYRLLLYFMENKNQTLPRGRILDRLWDIDGNFVSDNTLTVTVKRLREKLGHTSCIRTIRGIGYRMEDNA